MAAAKEWKFTAPAEGKVCFTASTLKFFSDKECATAATGKPIMKLADAKVGTCNADGSTDVYMVACTETEIHYLLEAKTTKDAVKCDAETAKTAGKVTADLKKLTFATAAVDGKYACQKVKDSADADIWVKATGAGWAEAEKTNTTNATNATGAKALAGALAAGALAVAATQF